MRLRTPAYRTAAAAFTVLQLLGAAFWPVVDARLEAAEQSSVAHVEAERTTPCTPGHDDFFCQVCRTVSLAGRTSTQGVYAFDTNPVLRVADATLPVLPRYHTLSPAHGPRAPPFSQV